MANIKSAKKRVKVNAKKAARNKAIRSSVKTAVKKVVVAVENNNVDEAKVALVNAITSIDKATTKGIFHKKSASRKKSSLTKQVNKIA
ncbi:MAG TPA: 30S ribosomal protein S20 [Epulopiscium sp.]|nr:30S ribosomal protein S20 [Candidatus Epulonipiscium sp.]